jgi:23S rRNA (uridine2552-2'-O)-methyltransferase
VIDLGCAPGSWLQVVEAIIGQGGLAVGIDLQEVRPIFGPRVTTMVADAFATDPATLLEPLGGTRADALISDMAPNTTGHGDDFLSARLCRRVLELAPHVLRPGGTLVMKVLEGADMPDLIKETRAMFVEAGATKPAASRDVSREIFIWATGFKSRRPATEPSHDAPGPR